MGFRPARVSLCWPRPTAPTYWTPRSCGRAASIATSRSNLPTKKGRLEILKVHTRNVPLAPNVDLDRIARSTVGMSGADLANLVNEAALLATREDKEAVDALDMDAALDKVILGAKREEVITEKDKRATAYHEVGHALVGWLTPRSDPVHKVTIIPRGRASA